jgi:hypothetical protein
MAKPGAIAALRFANFCFLDRKNKTATKSSIPMGK